MKCLVVYQNQPDLAGHLDLYTLEVLPEPGEYSFKQLIEMLRRGRRIAVTRGNLEELLSRQLWDKEFLERLGECKEVVVAVVIGWPYHEVRPPVVFIERLEGVKAVARPLYGELIEGSFFKIHIPYSTRPVKPAITKR